MSSVESGEVVPLDIPIRGAVGSLDISLVTDGMANIYPLQYQVSAVSSVQWSPNRVREDFTYDTMDSFPVFQVSQDNVRYLQKTSPVTSPDSRNIPGAPDSLPNEATGSLDSIVGSPVTSLSLTDFAADLSILSAPLIPLPGELLLLPVSLPGSAAWESLGSLPPLGPITSADTSQVDQSREGPFDAYCEPSDTDGHPLISTRLPGCPNRMTSYREHDIAGVDPTFGVQVHHSRFLEYIEVPESARLFTGRMGPSYGPPGHPHCRIGITTVCWPHGLKLIGT